MVSRSRVVGVKGASSICMVRGEACPAKSRQLTITYIALTAHNVFVCIQHSSATYTQCTVLYVP